MPWVSNATPGSEPKSVPFVVAGGGRGRSTAPKLLPPFVEKYARMGRRKISFEPPTTWAGFEGLIVTDVSLCGPSSLLASTLVPTENGDVSDSGASRCNNA